MQVVWVGLLAAVTNLLLLQAAAQMCSHGFTLWRGIAGAVCGALLTVLTMLPGIAFFQTFWWRLVMLQVTTWIAYGLSWRTGLLFSVLHLSLSTVTASQSGYLSTFVGAAGICLACISAEHKHTLVPVSLPAKDGHLTIVALRDTGNTLKDPITGRSVLVVDVEVSSKLTDLKESDLRDPVEALQNHPDLRLIPYRTIDSTGFLLAKCFQNVTIGTKKGSALVAFSPQKFSSKYQALTGGDLW